jgi:hypothetical protein
MFLRSSTPLSRALASPSSNPRANSAASTITTRATGVQRYHWWPRMTMETAANKVARRTKLPRLLRVGTTAVLRFVGVMKSAYRLSPTQLHHSLPPVQQRVAYSWQNQSTDNQNTHIASVLRSFIFIVIWSPYALVSITLSFKARGRDSESVLLISPLLGRRNFPQ